MYRTGLDKQRFSVNIFLPIILSICFGCSKELSHGDGSFEYLQHMFWLRNKKKILLHTLNLFKSPDVQGWLYRGSYMSAHVLLNLLNGEK